MAVYPKTQIERDWEYFVTSLEGQALKALFGTQYNEWYIQQPGQSYQEYLIRHHMIVKMMDVYNGLWKKFVPEEVELNQAKDVLRERFMSLLLNDNMVSYANLVELGYLYKEYQMKLHGLYHRLECKPSNDGEISQIWGNVSIISNIFQSMVVMTL